MGISIKAAPALRTEEADGQQDFVIDFLSLEWSDRRIPETGNLIVACFRDPAPELLEGPPMGWGWQRQPDCTLFWTTVMPGDYVHVFRASEPVSEWNAHLWEIAGITSPAERDYIATAIPWEGL